jgi:predicted nucleotidyltransferase
MKNIEAFLAAVKLWGETQSDIWAILLVGSYARGQAREDSDVDLVVLTNRPGQYLDNHSFAESFGIIKQIETEYWGRVTSFRIWYQDSFEVELGITTPDWITEDPLDSGTLKTISDGAKVIIDRIGNLEKLISAVKNNNVVKKKK